VNAPLEQSATGPRSVGWDASLSLKFARRRGRTQIVERKHVGPLVVQRPFFPEGEICHTLLLHPPGGMVGHDKLSVNIDVGADGHALITTPGANKLYRSDRKSVTQMQALTVAADACLEWLPQALIVFDGAFAELRTTIRLGARSRFIGWEQFCLGRPAIGERFGRGRLHQVLSIKTADPNSHVSECWTVDGGSDALDAQWGLGGCPALASMYAYPASPEALEIAQQATIDGAGSMLGATRLGELLIVRLRADDAERAQQTLEKLWERLRPVVANTPARRPRIWAT
tara:strand:- start:121 stop:978 length:858 start_codon:yes stop_codon:yes gene_type:complete